MNATRSLILPVALIPAQKEQRPGNAEALFSGTFLTAFTFFVCGCRALCFLL
jgi:hypothetical protein